MSPPWTGALVVGVGTKLKHDISYGLVLWSTRVEKMFCLYIWIEDRHGICKTRKWANETEGLMKRSPTTIRNN